MAKKSKRTDNSICSNRKVSRQYEILERIECGIVLKGSEVKSLRERSASIDEAYARLDQNQVWLIGCHIAQYSHDQATTHDSLRKKKLLLRNREINKIKLKIEQKGLTLVPLKMYFNDRGIAKVLIALAKGKTTSDKRQSLKAREDKRDMDRATRRRR